MSDTTDRLPEAEAEPKRHSWLADLVIRLVKEKPLGAFGGLIVLLLLFTGIFADFHYLTWVGVPDEWADTHGLAPYGYNEFNMADKLAAPSAKYWLGADNLGRDLLSRIIHGARISMYVGLGATAISVLVATIIGSISGYLGGKFDIIAQRFVDAWLCFPGLIFLLAIMALVGPGLVQVIIVLGVSSGIGSSRLVRSAVIAIKENVYVQAAKAIGASTGRIVFRHLLPNIMALVIVMFTLGMAGMILTEASLSFLGLGIPPPVPSWGGMLSQAGRTYMYEAPWLAIWPGVALTLVVYGISMWGDAVRDILDPRLRGGVGRYGGVKVKAAKVRGEPGTTKA